MYFSLLLAYHKILHAATNPKVWLHHYSVESLKLKHGAGQLYVTVHLSVVKLTK